METFALSSELSKRDACRSVRRSFEKLPNDRPIRPCQFRTGRRYISADNFQTEKSFDKYLGREDSKKLSKMDSFSLASDSVLEFQLLCEEFLNLFKTADESTLDRLLEFYKNEVSFLRSQTELSILKIREKKTKR